MAVDALELRPRGAVALCDAAIRLCATSAGVWAITLPAGAALVAALFAAVDAARLGEPLAWPVAALTAAWALRAVSQGAACHHVEQQVLSREEPTVRASWLAAVRRAPSLITTAAVLGVINALILSTMGVAYLFVGAHLAGYAATMRGQGNPLAVYGTCSKLLGPARQTATWVRISGLTQVLVFFNLHLAVTVGAQLGSALLGLDLTYAQRFASLDNPVWVAVLGAVTFTLYEPLRAASAALLLVDGRVRQEGLDLLAAVEQLPQRRKHRAAPVAATLALAFLPLVAHAQETLQAERSPSAPSQSALRGRLDRLLEECDLQERVDPVELDDLDALDARNQSSLSRFVSRVERRAYDDEDCTAAEADLREGLNQIHATRVAEAAADAAKARARAAAILDRPEFQATPPSAKVEPPKPEKEPPGWLARLMERFFRWLRDLLGTDRETVSGPSFSFGGEMLGANVVIIAAVVVLVAVLVYLLLRGRDRSKDGEDVESEASSMSETPLADDAWSALSRPPEGWAGLADQLARDGRYREAIRHLYLALLARLHRDGVIDYDPTRSNWDYLLAFKGSGDARGRFRELTRRFDFAWYGNVDVNALAWGLFRQNAEPLLAPSAEGPAHA